MDSGAALRQPTSTSRVPAGASDEDELWAVEAVLGEPRRDRRVADQRRNDGRSSLQSGARLGGDPFGADAAAAVGFEAVDVEAKRLGQRPEIRQLLVTLAREQRPRERPERALPPRGLGGLGSAAGWHPA